MPFLKIKTRQQTTSAGINYRAVALECATTCYTKAGEDYTSSDVLNLANLFCLWLEKNEGILQELNQGILE